MPRLLSFFLLSAFTGIIPAFGQGLKQTFPATRYEATSKVPLFRNPSDTLKGPEHFLPAGTSLSAVGLWSPRWAIVSHNGYLYIVPAQRLKGFDPNHLPALPPSNDTPPAFPINSDTKLITYEGVVEVPGATKDQLYDRALEWMAKTYQSANDVVQIKDKEQGKLLAKGGIAYVFRNQPAGYVIHTQTIYVKDGRYKYLMTGFRHQYVSTVAPVPRDVSAGALEQTTPPDGIRKKAWYDILHTTHDKVKYMIANLEEAMQAKGKDPSKF